MSVIRCWYEKHWSEWLPLLCQKTCADRANHFSLELDCTAHRSRPANIPLNTNRAFRARKEICLPWHWLQDWLVSKKGLDPPQPQETREPSGARVLISTNVSIFKVDKVVHFSWNCAFLLFFYTFKSLMFFLFLLSFFLWTSLNFKYICSSSAHSGVADELCS